MFQSQFQFKTLQCNLEIVKFPPIRSLNSLIKTVLYFLIFGKINKLGVIWGWARVWLRVVESGQGRNSLRSSRKLFKLNISLGFWNFIILYDRSNLRNTFNFHSFFKFLIFQLFIMTKRMHSSICQLYCSKL